MIRQRIHAGLRTIKATIAAKGNYISKAGIVRKRLGRPNADLKKIEAARRELARGTGVLKTPGWWGLARGRCTVYVGRYQPLKGAPSCRGVHSRRVLAKPQRVDHRVARRFGAGPLSELARSCAPRVRYSAGLP
jgi:hypothetical protein